MADTLKVLGQLAPSNTNLTTLYTVPSPRTCTVSSIVVCNRAATDTTFRVSVAVNSAADDNKQYLYYDHPIEANATFIATIGMSLGVNDKVSVQAGNTNLSFNLFGVEIS